MSNFIELHAFLLGIFNSLTSFFNGVISFLNSDVGFGDYSFKVYTIVFGVGFATWVLYKMMPLT